jgi:hypothetical protein
VLVSVLATAPDHPMSLHRAKYAADSYLETWVGIIGAKLADGGRALVFGPGRNPVNLVSAHDVAAAGGRPGRPRHVPLPMLRAMSLLARPASPASARQAQAAVVMNNTDMAVELSGIRDRLPTIPATTLDQCSAGGRPGHADGSASRSRSR